MELNVYHPLWRTIVRNTLLVMVKIALMKKMELIVRNAKLTQISITKPTVAQTNPFGKMDAKLLT